MSATRRTLLAAPVAVAVIPQAAAAAAAPAAPLVSNAVSCFELSLRAARMTREYQALEKASGVYGSPKYMENEPQLVELTVGFEAIRSRILCTRARTVPDVVAKLLVAMERISEAMNDIEAIEPCEDVENAMRDCIIALSNLAGVSLIDLAADWYDHPLMQRLMPELERVLPAIYAA